MSRYMSIRKNFHPTTRTSTLKREFLISLQERDWRESTEKGKGPDENAINTSGDGEIYVVIKIHFTSSPLCARVDFAWAHIAEKSFLADCLQSRSNQTHPISRPRRRLEWRTYRLAGRFGWSATCLWSKTTKWCRCSKSCQWQSFWSSSFRSHLKYRTTFWLSTLLLAQLRAIWR